MALFKMQARLRCTSHVGNVKNLEHKQKKRGARADEVSFRPFWMWRYLACLRHPEHHPDHMRARQTLGRATLSCYIAKNTQFMTAYVFPTAYNIYCIYTLEILTGWRCLGPVTRSGCIKQQCRCVGQTNFSKSFQRGWLCCWRANWKQHQLWLCGCVCLIWVLACPHLTEETVWHTIAVTPSVKCLKGSNPLQWRDTVSRHVFKAPLMHTRNYEKPMMGLCCNQQFRHTQCLGTPQKKCL